MTLSGRRGNSRAARSTMEATAGVGEEGGGDDSMTLQGGKCEHRLEHGEAKLMVAVGTDEGATTMRKSDDEDLRHRLFSENPTKRRRSRRWHFGAFEGLGLEKPEGGCWRVRVGHGHRRGRGRRGGGRQVGWRGRTMEGGWVGPTTKENGPEEKDST